MANDFIKEVSEADFEYEVISYSLNTPVVVDFWADWCRPCKPLTMLLERVAHESQGGFRLALVDSDKNPNLAIRFNVRSLPTVKVFSGGAVVAEFVGAQPESRVREFLAQIQPPSPAALMIEKGVSLAANEDWQGAEQVFRDALDLGPDSPEGLLGLARSLLAQGKSHEALSILTSFPASRQYNQAQTLMPLGMEMENLRRISFEVDLDDRQAAYWNSIRLASRARVTQALDGLMDLLRTEKQDQAARKMALALLELLGNDNSSTREYRKELSAILF